MYEVSPGTQKKAVEKLDGWLQRADLGWVTLERKVRTAEPGDPGQEQLGRLEVDDLVGMTPQEVLDALIDEEHLARGGALQVTAHFVNAEGKQKYIRVCTLSLVREGWGTRTGAGQGRQEMAAVVDSLAAHIDAVGLRNDQLMTTLIGEVRQSMTQANAGMEARLTDHLKHHAQLMEVMAANTELRMKVHVLENTGLLDKLAKADPKVQQGVLNMVANIAGEGMKMSKAWFAAQMERSKLETRALELDLQEREAALLKSPTDDDDPDPEPEPAAAAEAA